MPKLAFPVALFPDLQFVALPVFGARALERARNTLKKCIEALGHHAAITARSGATRSQASRWPLSNKKQVNFYKIEEATFVLVSI